MKKLLLLFIIIPFIANGQKVSGLAKTPPLGWNSWNTFGTEINEELVKGVAESFEKYGYKAAGYQYIIMDDGWMAKERDLQGNLVPDPIKFPHGLKYLSDYIHGKGLKFGIYNSAGFNTCAGYPGARGHEYQDAIKYAEWGVDYLKLDWCGTENLNAKGAYQTTRDALYKTKRPILLAICEWGDTQPWNWASEIGHTYRISGDIINCWDCEIGHGSWSSWGVWKILRMRQGLRKSSGPDHFADFDMMEVGNGMTAGQDRVHFVMWAMMGSPLIMGNDVRVNDKQTIDILTNKEVIAVNQDSLGIMAFLLSNEHDFDTWAKPLANGDWALVFVNMREEKRTLTFDWKKHPIKDDQFGKNLVFNDKEYELRDLFAHKNIGDTSSPLQIEIPGQDLLMLRVSAKK